MKARRQKTDGQTTGAKTDRILLAHGSGGVLSHELIHSLFARHFYNSKTSPILDNLRTETVRGDAAVLQSLPPGNVALTTDSYVVKPLFFPGGDIGKLAICGTVNDLAVAGATPLYLSAGFILEEGLPMDILERVVISMTQTSHAAGVQIVTGDTKVVEHGAADGLFINTAGIGIIASDTQNPIVLTPANLRAGDVLLINGTVGDHGVAVMTQREELSFGSALESDCAPLNGLIAVLLSAVPGAVRCMRDATRGGIATVLNEWAEAGVGIEIEEEAIPVREEVRAVCEFLGLDPLYAANEGKVVIAVASEAAETALAALRSHPLGENAAVIGHVTAEHAGRVVLRTPYGARRILLMLTGAQLPRIC